LILFDRDAEDLAPFVANLASFVLDFCARRKLGGTSLTYFVLNQLPILAPGKCRGQSGSESKWFAARVLELLYTCEELASLAGDLGYEGPPFRWDEERRFLIRCELDAAFFHLYGISRDDADYIMETFPIVKRKDEDRFGEYRTKRVILE